MTIEHLDTGDPTWVDDPRLADYRQVRDPLLVKQSARFVAEGRLVVRTLLEDSPLEACSVLVDETALSALGDLLTAHPEIPTYVVPAGALQDLTGWSFHQGCLAVGVRPEPIDVPTLLARAGEPRLVLALDDVSNPDNVGAMFRSAAALGAGAVVLSPACASPLYRKAIRSSMGAALHLPFAHGVPWEDALRALAGAGHALVALSPAAEAPPIDAVAAALPPDGARTLVMGAEGAGLGTEARALATRHARIPMRVGMDSLNVAAAAAIALHRLGQPFVGVPPTRR